MKTLIVMFAFLTIGTTSIASANLVEDGSALEGPYVNINCLNNVGDGHGLVLGTAKTISISTRPGTLIVSAKITREEIVLTPEYANFVFATADGFQNSRLIDKVDGIYVSPTRIVGNQTSFEDGEKYSKEYSLDPKTNILTVFEHKIIGGIEKGHGCRYKKTN